jgi:glyoxylase-like metal-dependent hydrolase (beta-lactamase superfamily II)
LPITSNSGDTERVIYPALLKDENELILIDCGYPDSMPKLENAMQKYNLSLSQLTKIVITHHDQI